MNANFIVPFYTPRYATYCDSTRSISRRAELHERDVEVQENRIVARLCAVSTRHRRLGYEADPHSSKPSPKADDPDEGHDVDYSVSHAVFPPGYSSVRLLVPKYCSSAIACRQGSRTKRVEVGPGVRCDGQLPTTVHVVYCLLMGAVGAKEKPDPLTLDNGDVEPPGILSMVVGPLLTLTGSTRL